MDELDYQLYQKWLSALFDAEVSLEETKLAFADKSYADKFMAVDSDGELVMGLEELDQRFYRDESNLLRYDSGSKFTGRIVKNGIIENYVDGLPMSNSRKPFYVDLSKGVLGGRGFDFVGDAYVHEFDFKNGGASLINIQPNNMMLSSQPSSVQYNPSQYLRSIPSLVQKNRESWCTDVAVDDMAKEYEELPVDGLEEEILTDELLEKTEAEMEVHMDVKEAEASVGLPIVAGLLALVGAIGVAASAKTKSQPVVMPAEIQVAR